MEHMPPELHHSVCDYLPLEDVRKYRLVSKAFALAGATRLFRQLTFHASFDSFNRVYAVATHSVLRRHVKSLLWDANLWDLGEDVTCFEEYKGYLSRRHGPEEMEKAFAKLIGIGQHASLRMYQLDIVFELRRQYELYCQCKAEEATVLKQCLNADSLTIILHRFLNLEEIKIADGAHQDRSGKIFKSWPDSGFHELRGQELGKIHLLVRGEGSWRDTLKSGLSAQRAFENGMTAAGFQLRALEVNQFSWRMFESNADFVQLAKLCPNLSSLKLTITAQTDKVDHVEECRVLMKNGKLKEFITALTGLRDLDVAFPHNSDEYEKAVNLANVIPYTQEGLRSLSIRRFETSESNFIKLIRSNASTLKSLCLEDIYLTSRGSWVEIFNIIRREVHLSSAEFKGQLCDRIRPSKLGSMENGWDFYGGCYDSCNVIFSDHDCRKELGIALEKYLVHGGQCPLSHNKKEAVLRGFMDPVAGF